MKRLALLLALVLCLPLAAHADEASRRAKAQEMITLLHMDRMMTQMMDAMIQQVSATTKRMAGSNFTPEEQAKLDDFQKKIVQLIFAQINWKTMEPEYVDLYAKNFTDEELDSILAFYKSPAGISMVEKLPSLTTQAMQLTQAKMVVLEPQLKEMMADFAKSAADARRSQKTTPE